jgi:hypothetical protein
VVDGGVNRLVRLEKIRLTLKKGSSGPEPETDLATAGDVVHDMDALISSLREQYGDDQQEVIVVPASASDDSATQMQPSAPSFVDDRIKSIIERTHGPEYAGKIMDFFLRSNGGSGFNPYKETELDALLIRIQLGREDDLLSKLGLDREYIVNLIPKISRFSARLKHQKLKKSRKKKSRKKKSKNNRKTRKKKSKNNRKTRKKKSRKKKYKN